MSLCKYCGASIRWVHTQADRRMALDQKPDPAGNVVMVEGRAVVLGPNDDTRGQRWMPHAASCPWAQQRTSRVKARARAGRR